MASIRLTVDQTDSLAYITLSDKAVDTTIDHDGRVIVDLDEVGVAVGVELLDLDAVIPFDALTANYHVDSKVVDLLRRIQPTINSFMIQSKSRKKDGSDVSKEYDKSTKQLAHAAG